MPLETPMHSTTVLCVTHKGSTALASDGQVTLGSTVMKGSARKIRTLFGGRVLAGFAGSTADSFTLFELFERKLEKHSGDLTRSSVELAKDWRMDRNLRRLEAMLIVADARKQYTLSGVGDVIEPDEEISAIGSGGAYAKSAALALKRHSDLDAAGIVKEAMRIAGEQCIYTNLNLSMEILHS